MSLQEAIPAASQLVRLEWSRRIEAEYASSALTSQLVLWLIDPQGLFRSGNQALN